MSKVERLIRELKGRLWQERREAAGSLGHLGNPMAVPALIEALRDRSLRVREAAAEALGQLGDVKAVRSLVDILKDRSMPVREAAAEALGQLGEVKAVGPLMDALKDRSVAVREAAAKALGQIGDVVAVPPLIDALKDERSNVRRTAALALGEMADPAAIDCLVEALKDGSWHVRRAAAEALSKMKWKPSNEHERSLYLIAVQHWQALLRVGVPAVDALLVTLECDDYRVRSKAAQALGRIGDAKAVGPLIGVLRNSRVRVRQNAAKALVQIGTPAIEPLTHVLKDRNADIRGAVAQIIEQIRCQLPQDSKDKVHSILCPLCLCRFEEHKAQLGFLKSFSYYACRNCRGSSFIDNVKRVVAILDHSLNKPCLQDGIKLLVDWFSRRQPFDFDEIRIKDASDFDIDELVMKLRNDMDDKRRKRYKSIPVYLSPKLQLSQAKMHMLKDTFGRVERME